MSDAEIIEDFETALSGSLFHVTMRCESSDWEERWEIDVTPRWEDSYTVHGRTMIGAIRNALPRMIEFHKRHAS